MFNTHWIYVIVLVASASGFGAGRYFPQNSDLERQLQLAHQQIDELRLKCERTAMPRAEIKRPSVHKAF